MWSTHLERETDIARIWLNHILKNEIGMVVDRSKVDKEDYLLAMERSPIRYIEIKRLLKNALTDETNSRDVVNEHSLIYSQKKIWV